MLGVAEVVDTYVRMKDCQSLHRLKWKLKKENMQSIVKTQQDTKVLFFPLIWKANF